MGYYIDTTGCRNKGEYILNNCDDAIEILGAPLSIDDCEPHEVYVCVVDNGPFEAAAINHSTRELAAFSRGDDLRPKRWFIVTKDFALKQCPYIKSVFVSLA